MTRVVDALIIEGEDVSGLCSPGWMPDPNGIAKAAEYVKGLNPTPSDRIVIDLWSNSSFMGTDELGLPCKAYRSELDKRYHILGPLQAAPKQVYKHVLKEAAPLLEACSGALIVLVAPFPRYVSGGCCDSSSHLVNRNSNDLDNELYKAMERGAEAAAESELSRFKVFYITDLFECDTVLSSMVTSAGVSVWKEADPVHLTNEAYVEIGAHLLSLEDDKPAPSKRERLDSLVPAPPPKKRRGDVAPPLWVAGIASRQLRGGGGRGRGWRGGRGLRGGRGAWIPRGRGSGSNSWGRGRAPRRGNFSY